MLKTANKETLAEKIAGLLNTAPVSLDPEDDNNDGTHAKLIGDFCEENDNEEELLNTFRRQNIDLLADIDERYAGKKASRKSVRHSDEDTSETEDVLEKEYAESFENDYGIQTDEAVGFTEDADEVEEEVDIEDSDEYSSSGDNSDSASVAENEGNFEHFKDADTTSQVKKGLCVRNQMSMWENLLEMRIQLQKCLIAANKMPQQNKYIEIKKESGQEFSDQTAVAKKSLKYLLDKLLLLQKTALNRYPETKKLHKNSADGISKENSDEEILSDTEDEKSNNEEENELPKKKRRLSDFEEHINETHNLYKNYRNGVIQKWNDKTRIATLKNNAYSRSIIDHIEHTLSDRTKLVRRTQLKRSDFAILGEDSLAGNVSNDANINNSDNRPVEEYNSEIFDDDDFYHQLLRELIEVKSADLTDPVQLSRQWIQLQKLRSKMKRKIDTRATKGRKIRYTVHTKLVNFMAPIDECVWTDQAKTELFSSLFGKKEYVHTS